jgi:hypothetical protein
MPRTAEPEKIWVCRVDIAVNVIMIVHRAGRGVEVLRVQMKWCWFLNALWGSTVSYRRDLTVLAVRNGSSLARFSRMF